MDLQASEFEARDVLGTVLGKSVYTWRSASMTFAHSPATSSTILKGWQPQPNTRGTIDILWSCSSTIFVCVWVMIHLNIPARDDSIFILVLRKLKWFIMSLLAPELVMLFAGGQWASSCRSTRDMKAAGMSWWTMQHAFYAESGGFELHTPDCSPFPVTAQQLCYLVSKGYIDQPTITKEEIWDKSKADKFVKAIAALQSAWFVVQIAARAIEGLAITLLELSVLCLMTCTAATLFFWFHKPLDVRVPTVVTSKVAMAFMLSQAGDLAKQPYSNTPLDFAEPLDYTSSQFPLNHWWGERRRPLPRIPNDRDSLLHSWRVVLIIAVPTAAFGTLQLIAWNFAFPSRIEQMLWRYTCVSNGTVLGLGCAFEAGAIMKSNYTKSGMRTFNNYKTTWPWMLFFLVPGMMYFGARMVVIIEVIISLRALPESCFTNVQWSSFIPHFS